VVRVPGYRSRGLRFDSRCYQIFSEVVSLERGTLCPVGITEELREWKSSGSGSRKPRLKTLEDPLRWPRDTVYLWKLALISPTSGGRSVSIIRLRIKATEKKTDRGVRVRVSGGTRIVFSPLRPDRLWGPSNLLSTGYRGLFPWGLSGWGVKLTTHLQLVPRSRKCGSIHPLPIRLHGIVLDLVKHRVNFTLRDNFTLVSL
jgi:hypothetical protein